MTLDDIHSIEKEVIKTLDTNNSLFPIRFGKDADKQGMIILNHFQNTETMESLIILAKNGKSGDTGTLARSIFESVLNIGLLLYLPSKEGVNRYRNFISVESLKVYKHMSTIEKDVAEKIYKPSEIKKYEWDAKEYEAKYGRPKSTWSGLSAVDICRLLDEKMPPVIKTDYFFEFLYCQVYRYGSAAIHRSQMGLLRNISINSKGLFEGKSVHSMKAREEGLIFNYFHGLVSFIASMRLLGEAFKIVALEDYFQKRIGFLIGGYPE